MADIITVALDLIAAYGLIAILVLLVLDGALLLPVFPGEIVLIMAVAAYVHDIPSLIFIILVTTAAGLVGSLLLYGIIRGGGRRLVERFPRFFMMPRKRRERLERAFERPVGQSMVLFLRLVPLTRILVNIPAGLARMPFVRFVILSTIGLLAYHTAFLWFAFEANRPGSAVSDQRQYLQEAYASPAWAFVEANQIITGIGLLALGAVIAARAAAKMHKDPEESTGSLIGWVTTVVLLWGGLALGVATYMEPDAVYALVDVGGVDIHAVAAGLGYSAVEVLWGVSAVAVAFGFTLSRMRRTAKRRRRRFKTRKALLQGARSATPDRDEVAFLPVYSHSPSAPDRDAGQGPRALPPRPGPQVDRGDERAETPRRHDGDPDTDRAPSGDHGHEPSPDPDRDEDAGRAGTGDGRRA